MPHTGPDRGAVPFHQVLKEEVEQIERRRREFKIDATATQHDLLGLAISGGGIRSATFSLGILQRLAERGMLKQLDYLSTVSGGGYIGSWLYSWIRRAQTERDPGAPARTPQEGFDHVCERLSTRNKFDPNETPEAEEITFLRQYSSYLTPRKSLLSADTWLLAVTWLRNTLLNLTILITGFAAVVLVARALGKPAAEVSSNGAGGEIWPLIPAVVLLAPIIALMGWNLWRNSTIALSDAPPENRDHEISDSGVRWFCIFPLLSAIVFSLWLSRARAVFVTGSLWEGVWLNFAVLSSAFLVLQLCGRTYECFARTEEKVNGSVSSGSRIGALAMYLIGPLSAGFVTAALLRAIALLFETQHGHPAEPWLALTWGPPLVLLVFAAGVVVHIGLMGRDLPEASREWLGRLRSWTAIFTAFWIAVAGVAIYGPWIVAWIGAASAAGIAALGTGWIATTVGGFMAGNSGKTSGEAQDNGAAAARSAALEILALAAPYVFMVGFAFAVAFGVHAILVHDLPGSGSGFQWILNGYWGHLTATEFIVADPKKRWFLSGLLPLLALAAITGLLLAWRVDINIFSMHNFYKNRLVRCYLGASRERQRKPNPFTGFDDYDDASLDLFTNSGSSVGEELRANGHNRREEMYVGPYPIVNATLNVTAGGKLQYQERKGQSFIFTPLYSGFSAETVADEMRLGDSAHPSSLARYQQKSQRRGAANEPVLDEPAYGRPCAYRSTKLTAGRVSVGMAVAISGAAVSPNMGYHTSTAVSFLLTVFNVRLGWWLGNALKSSFRSPGPPFGLMYTIRELFGLANADSSYVNVTDGGHFDNMGIYELVRRRCRYIICCDAEEDADMSFNGIGNAIRKCRTDFGVDIDLPLERLRKADGFSRVHCAVGVIKYHGFEGYIVYLKSSLTGDEAADVLEYRARKPEFPQETTADQWFDESQFESYRRLGYHIADKAFANVELGRGSAHEREHFFKDLFRIWYPPSAAVDKQSAAHSEMYARILESIRRDDRLDDLDPALFEGFGRLAGRGDWSHNSGHVCNELMQLMERVFYDLGLEDPDQREHPYVQGWIDMFKYWANQKPFQNTWAVTKDSYPERFCKFYESLVDANRLAAKK